MLVTTKINGFSFHFSCSGNVRADLCYRGQGSNSAAIGQPFTQLKQATKGSSGCSCYKAGWWWYELWFDFSSPRGHLCFYHWTNQPQCFARSDCSDYTKIQYAQGKVYVNF